MSGNLFICAKSDGQNLRRPTLTEAFPDPAKPTFPDACLLRFRISRLARADHGGVWLCTDWVRTDATTEVVLRLAASDPPSSTLCRDGHCKWVSPNDDGGNSESKDELFHQIPPMSRNVLNLPACAVPVARSSVATPVRSSFFICLVPLARSPWSYRRQCSRSTVQAWRAPARRALRRHLPKAPSSIVRRTVSKLRDRSLGTSIRPFHMTGRSAHTFAKRVNRLA